MSTKTDFPQEQKYNMRERNIKGTSCENPNKLHRNGERQNFQEVSPFSIIPHINASLGTVIGKLSIEVKGHTNRKDSILKVATAQQNARFAS